MMQSICTFDGCEKPHHARRLCKGHWKQRRRGQELRPLRPSSRGLTLEERFWAKVTKTDECWVWTAATNGRRYGRFNVDGRLRPAHRVSWEFINGPVPKGMLRDHRCGNRACVNPEHLRIVTASENMQHQTGPRKDSSSGVRGVYWNKDRNAWQAYATLNGRRYSSGYHPTLEAADQAARALRKKLHTHDDHSEWSQRQEEAV